jgi:hypothetical protein
MSKGDFRSEKYSQVLVAQACNPSYLGNWDLKNHCFRLAWAKTFMRTHLNRKVWEWCCVPSSQWSRMCKIGGSQSRPAGQKARPFLQNNQGKKIWRHGSTRRVAAWQAQTPIELKQSFQISTTDWVRWHMSVIHGTQGSTNKWTVV